MKLLFTRFFLLSGLLFFHCDTNEPTFYKTTIITYLGSGDVVVESIFKNIPNIPTRIMTDGIMTPNYMYVLDASINGIPIDTSKFEFNYDKTEKGNFKYISLKNSYFKSSHDTIYIKYRTNVLTNYQSSLNELRYLFPFKMVEIMPQSTPIVNVRANLSLRSESEKFLPRVLFFNNYKIKDSDSLGNVFYEREYKCTDYDQLLFLTFPNFIYQLNTFKIIGEYEHWLSLKDIQLCEEGYRLTFKQIDSTKGIFFHLPFKKSIAFPEIRLNIGNLNISPFPLDSANFYSKLNSGLKKTNESYYYIGYNSNPYENMTKYSLNLIFATPPNEVGKLEFKFKYSSADIVKKVDCFNYEILIEPQYLPSIKALDKLEISIPDNFTFQKDETFKNQSYTLGEHSLIFNNVNKPEIFRNPLILLIVKDGLTFYNFIKIVNFSIFIASILFLAMIHFKIITINLKKLNTIIFQIPLFFFNLFLVGFSKEENIIELFMFVLGYLPMLSVMIISFYIFKPTKNKMT